MEVQRPKPGKINNIKCEGKVIAIAKLKHDPLNARLHPEKNMHAIEDSLNVFGQMSPITVRKQNMTVMKGNGTLAAAKALGWTQIAASVIPMTDLEATGYGVADNRTAELATWNIEVMSRIARLGDELHPTTIGWSAEEVMALRANVEEFTPIQGTEEFTSADLDKLWQGMPEFSQEDQTSFKSIVVHFRNEEDFGAFLKLVKQTPGDVRQKSIWHPKAEIGRFADKRYVAQEKSK